MAQTIKNLPTTPETWVGSLGREDPLEECMATYSNIVGLENPHGQRRLAGTDHGVAQSDTTEQLSINTHLEKQMMLNIFSCISLPLVNFLR